MKEQLWLNWTNRGMNLTLTCFGSFGLDFFSDDELLFDWNRLNWTNRTNRNWTTQRFHVAQSFRVVYVIRKDRIRMFWTLLPETRSQNNNFFFAVEYSASRSIVWHIIPANILFIVNVIFTDGIRVFLNTLTKKIEANCKITIFCSGIINLLFDGFAYNTSGHFVHCSYFSSPLRGSEEYYATRKISARIINNYWMRFLWYPE